MDRVSPILFPGREELGGFGFTCSRSGTAAAGDGAELPEAGAALFLKVEQRLHCGAQVDEIGASIDDVAAFRRLLGLVGVGDADAIALSSALLDWLDADDLPRLPTGKLNKPTLIERFGAAVATP